MTPKSWVVALSIMSALHAMNAVQVVEPLKAAPRDPPSAPAACVIMPSAQLPVLRWCETENEFLYDIQTWKQSYTFGKSQLLQNARSVSRGFLEQHCDLSQASYTSGRLELWITVPRSGAELAAPRLGLRLDLQRPDTPPLHLIFANAWEQEWTAGLDNLAILGNRSYDKFSGESLVGHAPGSLLLRPVSEENGAISESTLSALRNVGVHVTERLPGNLPIYQASSAVFRELEAIQAVQSSPTLPRLIRWIEANARVEALADKFLLYSEGLPPSESVCPLPPEKDQ